MWNITIPLIYFDIIRNKGYENNISDYIRINYQ
jgi:hypothetical protein